MDISRCETTLGKKVPFTTLVNLYKCMFRMDNFNSNRSKSAAEA